MAPWKHRATHASDAEPLVSIVMASYNNRAYLEQAVESCLGQKTSFPFRLIISDDCSTDGSQELIRRLAAKHDNIHVIQQPKNYIQKNYTDMLNAVRTRYAAFCDGDDFWTADDKLESQVRFLEENPDYTVCAHKTDVQIEGYDGPDRPQSIYKRHPSQKTRDEGILYADEIADNYYLHTSSYVFRWLYPDGLPPTWMNYMTNDHFLLLLHAAEGKVKYFDRSMSVWRRHNNGYTWLQVQKPSAYVREKWEQFITLQVCMDKFFEGRFHYQLQERIRFALHSIAKECAATGDMPFLSFMVSRYSEYFRNFHDKYAFIIDAYRQQKREIRPGAVGIRQDNLLAAPQAEKAMASPTPMGGAIPLDLEQIPMSKQSVWRVWTEGREHVCFHNAESALAALIWQHGDRVWLPAHWSQSLLQAVSNKSDIRIFYYNTGEDLTYPLRDIAKLPQPGDIIVTPCYFGRPLPAALRGALSRRSDIIWIEDRSQALNAGDSPSPWKVYAPAALLGVPDGGIITGEGLASWLPPQYNEDEDAVLERLSPPFLNYEFPARSFARATCLPQTQAWLEISREAMSKTTRALLERLPLKAISDARKQNWAALHASLHKYALWNIPVPSFVPAAFPLRVPKGNAASRIASFLSDQGIICPVIYSQMQTNRPSEALAERTMSLPCDHRYSIDDMERLARAVLRLLA